MADFFTYHSVYSGFSFQISLVVFSHIPRIQQESVNLRCTTALGQQACVFTVFTVAVSPVHPASVVFKKAPWSDPAIRVATVIVLPNSFARVALLEAAHFGPVHAPGAGLGDVYRAPVETVFAAALDAVGER